MRGGATARAAAGSVPRGAWVRRAKARPTEREVECKMQKGRNKENSMDSMDEIEAQTS